MLKHALFLNKRNLHEKYNLKYRGLSKKIKKYIVYSFGRVGPTTDPCPCSRWLQKLLTNLHLVPCHIHQFEVHSSSNPEEVC